MQYKTIVIIFDYKKNNLISVTNQSPVKTILLYVLKITMKNPSSLFSIVCPAIFNLSVMTFTFLIGRKRSNIQYYQGNSSVRVCLSVYNWERESERGSVCACVPVCLSVYARESLCVCESVCVCIWLARALFRPWGLFFLATFRREDRKKKSVCAKQSFFLETDIEKQSS